MWLIIPKHKEQNLKGLIALCLDCDIHNPCERSFIVSKVRINPGNYTDRNRGKIDYSEEEYNDELEKIKERLKPLIEICKKHNTAIRIGTNHGSLSERVVSRYGNTPYAMAVSAYEFAKICHSLGFDNLVLSQKSSNVKIMVASTRMLCEMLDKGRFELS